MSEAGRIGRSDRCESASLPEGRALPRAAFSISNFMNTSPTPRLVSLDALRGFDMFWILGADALVLALGQLSPSAPVTFLAGQLEHKAWAGFGFYDLIFPLFVFIVGVSLVFSLGQHLARDGRRAVVTRILRRTVVLFLLGIFYNGGLAHAWPDVRIAGVLQRIALAYGATALLFVFCRPRTLMITAASLLIGYWALLTFVPIRAFQLDAAALAVRLGSGQPPMADVRAAFAATTEHVTGGTLPGLNLANHWDFQHLPGALYDTYYDPEGILSTLPAVATCLLGVFAGLLLRRTDVPAPAKARWLAVGGVVAIVLGWAWGWEFPVIKKLWTSSYVLVAGGWSAVLLGAFYYVIDVREWRRWCEPFVWIGMNPITLYLATSVIGFHQIASRLVGGSIELWLNQHVVTGAGEIVVTLLSLGLVLALARFLYRRKIFLRV